MTMKLKKLTAAAFIGTAAAAAAAHAAGYMVFKKTVETGDNKGIPDFDMGTEWNSYIPMIQKKMDDIISAEPENHFIITPDKLKLSAKYYKADKESHKIVIAVHGYRSRGLFEFSGISSMYHDHGYNVLMLDNRAHGESEGKYAGFGVLDRKDVMQWIHYVLSVIDPDAEIYLHGVSMGGSTVLLMSGTSLPDSVKAIISDCAFINISDILNHVFKRKYGVSIAPLLKIASRICKRKAGYDFDAVSTLDAVGSASLPILFIHGAEDQFVPTDMSRKNYDACASDKKELCIVPGAGHAECYYRDPELYADTVIGFIEGL